MSKFVLSIEPIGASDDTPASEHRTRDGRTKMTFDIPDEVAREMRVAVSELPPKVVAGGMSGLATRALVAELERLRAEHNKGKPFESEDDPHVPRGPSRL